MVTGLETQVVQGLVGLVTLAASAGITYLSAHAKAWLTSHTSANVSAAANNVVDGLDKIAVNVVHDLNDRIIRDAQANGVLTPQLLAQVKADAVRSVMDQGSSLVALGATVVGNVPDLVAGLVAKSFKNTGIVPSVAGVYTPTTTAVV